MLHFVMVNHPSRRAFLRSAPLAAAAIPLSTQALHAEPAPSPVLFQLFTDEKLDEARKKLQATHGNDTLFSAPSLPFTIVLTTEEKKAAKEFEWHEGRDHILQILEGTTHYEVGGTPQGAHNTRPGEWLAPASSGATSYVLHKGDMLVIPRNTPHKRTTETSVTFYLISTTGEVNP